MMGDTKPKAPKPEELPEITGAMEVHEEDDSLGVKPKPVEEDEPR